MIFFTFLCWSSWIYVLFTINPEKTNRIGFVLFYLSMFLAASGLAALIGFLFRFVLLKHELVFHSVSEAFRQSFLFAILIVVSFFLLSKNMFSWTNLLLLMVGLSVVEFFLISQKN